jgi:hypothetical protein
MADFIMTAVKIVCVDRVLRMPLVVVKVNNNNPTVFFSRGADKLPPARARAGGPSGASLENRLAKQKYKANALQGPHMKSPTHGKQGKFFVFL